MDRDTQLVFLKSIPFSVVWGRGWGGLQSEPEGNIEVLQPFHKTFPKVSLPSGVPELYHFIINW